MHCTVQGTSGLHGPHQGEVRRTSRKPQAARQRYKEYQRVKSVKALCQPGEEDVSDWFREAMDASDHVMEQDCCDL